MAPADDEFSRYKVVGQNIEAAFYDDEQQVLVNKLGIRDATALKQQEETALARAYTSVLRELGSSQPLTADLIKKAHGQIFGQLYEWGGRWRTVKIAKGAMEWPPPMFLDESMRELEKKHLAKYPPTTLTSDKSFCEALAVIQGEFLAVHPFREGNARTIKLCTNVLAVRTGRPILAYDQSPEGRTDFINANKLIVYRQDYGLLTRIIEDALDRARTLHCIRAQDPQTKKIEKTTANEDQQQCKPEDLEQQITKRCTRR